MLLRDRIAWPLGPFCLSPASPLLASPHPSPAFCKATSPLLGPHCHIGAQLPCRSSERQLVGDKPGNQASCVPLMRSREDCRCWGCWAAGVSTALCRGGRERRSQPQSLSWTAPGQWPLEQKGSWASGGNENRRKRAVRVVGRYRSKHRLLINSQQPWEARPVVMPCVATEGTEAQRDQATCLGSHSHRAEIGPRADGLRQLCHRMQPGWEPSSSDSSLTPEASLCRTSDLAARPASSQEPWDKVWMEPQLWVP